jgi:hypothetical protein
MIARWCRMRPDVAMTWPIGGLTVLGVAWILRSLAPRRVGAGRQGLDWTWMASTG